MLHELEQIEGQTITIEFFKIWAQNSIRNNFSQEKIHRHIVYIDNKIEQYEHELESADAIETEELTIKINKQKERRQKYEAVEKRLIESNGTQKSVTDADAKALHMGNNGTEVGYCIQAATDQKNKFFVHAAIGGPTDKRELAPMALEAKHLLDLKTVNVLSDAAMRPGTSSRYANLKRLLLIVLQCLPRLRVAIVYPQVNSSITKNSIAILVPLETQCTRSVMAQTEVIIWQTYTELVPVKHVLSGRTVLKTKTGGLSIGLITSTSLTKIEIVSLLIAITINYDSKSSSINLEY
jgi:hypothetical protein